MNIKQAKEQIKNTMTAYFTKDARGNYVMPLYKQRPIFLMGPPGMGKTEIELKEFNRIYLSCPEAVRETLMDSIRTLAKHLTEFYSKIENP